MILLAIDPGYRESHAVYFDADAGRVVGARSEENAAFLAILRAVGSSPLGYAALIESMDPFGLRLGRETMDTILWIGRFMEAGRAELVPRSLIKMTLCGTRRADDASIRQVLIDRIGKPGTKKEPGPTYGVTKHLWQALAVAVTWLEVNGKAGDALRRSDQDLQSPSGPQSTSIDFPSASNPAPGDALSPGADTPLFNERRDDE